jgi:hypothetical protein
MSLDHKPIGNKRSSEGRAGGVETGRSLFVNSRWRF